MKEITFRGDKFTLNQCEDIWQWFATSKVFEFTHYYSQLVFHAPNDYFYAAYKDNLDNFVRI